MPAAPTGTHITPANVLLDKYSAVWSTPDGTARLLGFISPTTSSVYIVKSYILVIDPSDTTNFYWAEQIIGCRCDNTTTTTTIDSVVLVATGSSGTLIGLTTPEIIGNGIRLQVRGTGLGGTTLHWFINFEIYGYTP